MQIHGQKLSNIQFQAATRTTGLQDNRTPGLTHSSVASQSTVANGIAIL